MNTETIECGHSACFCVVAATVDGVGFCSEYCRDADATEEETDEGCACGHPPCDGA